MAIAEPSPTPNPDAMKFELDVTLPGTVSARSREAAAGDPFAEAVFDVDGVVGIYGTSSFVTVSRRPGADWEPIVAAVRDAAARLL